MPPMLLRGDLTGLGERDGSLMLGLLWRRSALCALSSLVRRDFTGLDDCEGALLPMLALLCFLSTLFALYSLTRREGLSFSISLGAFLGENSDAVSSRAARAGAKRADLRSRGEARVGDAFEEERRRLRDRGIFSGESWPSGRPPAAIAVASIFTQYVLTRARAIRAPSMHADLLTASICGTTPRNRCTKPK